MKQKIINNRKMNDGNQKYAVISYLERSLFIMQQIISIDIINNEYFILQLYQ